LELKDGWQQNLETTNTDNGDNRNDHSDGIDILDESTPGYQWSYSKATQLFMADGIPVCAIDISNVCQLGGMFLPMQIGQL